MQNLFDNLWMRLGIDRFWLSIPPNKLSVVDPDPYYLTTRIYLLKKQLEKSLKPIIYKIKYYSATASI